MRMLLLLAGTAMGLTTCARATEALDLKLLRDVICEHETRGVPERDLIEPGPAGEIGRCQIRISTARQLGFRGHWTLLLLPAFNEAWAAEKVRMGFKRHGTIFGTAFFYNRGKRPITKNDAGWSYAAQVSKEYNRRLFERARMAR